MKLFKKRLKTFLVFIESGKNNIAGCNLRIMKGVVRINVKSISDVQDNFQTIFKKEHGYNYSLYHYGSDPDWQIITEIKQL